jgi:glutathione S-transferase
MLTVYGDLQSGNCYKIKLLLSLLGREHNWEHLDILKGESRSESYLAKNPNGKIPLLELEDGRVIAESNAILNYLAQGSDFLPDERYQRALVLQWQFFEQYSHEPYIAVARYINKYLGLPAEREAEYLSKQEGGHRALAVMERQLTVSPFLIGDQFTIADISLYAYTHVAHEGGFDLSAYPAINTWLEVIAAMKGYTGMNGEA